MLIVDCLGMDDELIFVDFIVFIYFYSPSRRPGC